MVPGSSGRPGNWCIRGPHGPAVPTEDVRAGCGAAAVRGRDDQLPLPSQGMTVNISRITTATSVTHRASENTAVSNTDMDDNDPDRERADRGRSADVVRQALDRGTGIEDVVMMDLQRRYATTLDSTIVNQATTGLLAVATDVAYTDATPTGPGAVPEDPAGAAAGSEAAPLGQANPTWWSCFSRRWYWLSKEMTSTWPMIAQQGIRPRRASTTPSGTDPGSAACCPTAWPWWSTTTCPPTWVPHE